MTRMQMITLNHTSSPPKSPEPLTPPQTPEIEDSNKFSWNPMSVCLFIIIMIGALCLAFLITFGLRPFWFLPQSPRLPKNFALVTYEGNMVVYPSYINPTFDDGTNSSYLITLPPQNVEETSKSLQDIFASYPKSWSSNYSDCFVENPTYNKPCFFQPVWLGKACPETKDFGFSETRGKFNPCLVVQLQQTGNWTPVPEDKEDLPTSSAAYFDPQFVQLFCAPKSRIDARNMQRITVYPAKGFPTRFFPISDFNPELYLPPSVAIQVTGIEKGQNVTIECVLLTQNILKLWDKGLFTVTFVSR